MGKIIESVEYKTFVIEVVETKEDISYKITDFIGLSEIKSYSRGYDVQKIIIEAKEWIDKRLNQMGLMGEKCSNCNNELGITCWPTEMGNVCNKCYNLLKK